jgi:hypothetical protein
LPGHLSQAGVGLRLVAVQARWDRLGACLACMFLREGGPIDCANQHAGQIYRHNLRMPAHTKLTNPYTASLFTFGVAVQSNKVYPPRLRFLAATNIAWRQINAIR